MRARVKMRLAINEGPLYRMWSTSQLNAAKDRSKELAVTSGRLLDD